VLLDHGFNRNPFLQCKPYRIHNGCYIYVWHV
jgi:hypothetical protein